MKISDSQIKTILVGCILVYLLALLASEFIFHNMSFIMFLNTFSSSLVIFYWVIRKLKVTTHHFELREMVALILELVACVLSICTLLANPLMAILIVISYVIFTVHLLVLIGCLSFMITFRINKLF